MTRRGKPPSNSAQERRGIQSVEVSAVILSALAEARGAVFLKDLSDSVDMPSSKVHRYLSSFIRSGFVHQNEITGQYDLGSSSLRLGLSALSRFDVIDEASQQMKLLSDSLDLTSLLSIWGPSGPTIVRWQRSPETLITSLTLGSVLPLLRSATGHVFLSYLPGALTDSMVRSEIAKMRHSGQKTMKQRDVKMLVSDTRESGLSYVDSSVVPGLQAIAAPILDPQGEASAAITLIGTNDHASLQDGSVLRDLLGTTRRLSLNTA